MFIKQSRSGYGRGGEQFARGKFLALFSHNPFKWEDENNKPHFEDNGKIFPVHLGEGFVTQRECNCAGKAPYNYTEADKVPAYYLEQCPVHGGEWRTMPSALNRKLYALVRHTSLRQVGHFMMGTINIGGQRITVSGSYGANGLPMDVEKIDPANRWRLVEVPAAIAEIFWNSSDGWNGAGSEGPIIRQWALDTFK